MSVALPSHPAPVAAEPSYIDWGGVLRPVFGGALQKLRRLGDRFALAVELPPLDNVELGMAWISALIAARREGAIMNWPLAGFRPGVTGFPVVFGAGNAGSQLPITGLAPGYPVRPGQFFSIIHGGRRYLHEAEAAVTANGNGSVILPIAPMLRISPSDGAVCEFAMPKIEGLLDGDRQSWTLDVALNVGLSFTIMEAR